MLYQESTKKNTASNNNKKYIICWNNYIKCDHFCDDFLLLLFRIWIELFALSAFINRSTSHRTSSHLINDLHVYATMWNSVSIVTELLSYLTDWKYNYRIAMHTIDTTSNPHRFITRFVCCCLLAHLNVVCMSVCALFFSIVKCNCNDVT